SCGSRFPARRLPEGPARACVRVLRGRRAPAAGQAITALSMFVNTCSRMWSRPTAVITVRLGTETTKPVPSTRTSELRAPLAAARLSPSPSRAIVAGSSGIPRCSARCRAWPLSRTGALPSLPASTPANPSPGRTATPGVRPRLLRAGAGPAGPRPAGSGTRASGGRRGAHGDDRGRVDRRAADPEERRSPVGAHAVDDAARRRAVRGGVGDLLPDQRDRLGELGRRDEALERALEVRDALDERELRLLGDEGLVVDRAERVLVAELGDEELQEVMLAELRGGVHEGLAGGGVGGRGRGRG